MKGRMNKTIYEQQDVPIEGYMNKRMYKLMNIHTGIRIFGRKSYEHKYV